jgi:hypothetical protein
MSSVLSAQQREQLHAKFDQVLDGLSARLTDEEEVEATLQQEMRRLSRSTLQAWADGASKADGAPCCSTCGRSMRHLGCPTVTLETTFGPVQFRRPRRRCEACEREVYPHDASLRFGQHAVTWRLARLVVRLDARHPFGEAQRLLREDFGVELSKHTFEEIVLHAGERVLEQDDAQRAAFFSLPVAQQQARLPTSTLQPHLVVVSMDATKIHAEGDWRDIRVGRVMAEDAEGQRLDQKSFARFLPVEEVGRQLFLDAYHVGWAHAVKRVVIGDGAPWIWENASLLFPDATTILDWYHVSENVHNAAAELNGRDTDEARAWAKGILDELWEGRGAQARQKIREARATLRSPNKREALRKLHGYLQNNASRMDYPRYRAAGLPIGSGTIESHCKWLVGRRCKDSGMRNWGQRRAESVLRFRAAIADDDFDTLWVHRLRTAA